jgi:hypothetical protein
MRNGIGSGFWMCFDGLCIGIGFVAIISSPSDNKPGSPWTVECENREMGGKERGRGRKRRTRTIRRSNNLFELSLHPANKYFPSLSNSTDVISPRQSASVCTHIPPIASHNLICLSFPLSHQFPLFTSRGMTKRTYPEASSFPVLS